MNAKDRELVVLLGIPFDNLSMDETVSRVEEFVSAGEPRYLATANVNFVVRAMQDDEFREIVRLADVITADGMPLVWASRLMGHPLKERVTGSDLVPRLVALAERKGWGVFFLGGEPGVAQEAIDRLKVRHPGLKAASRAPEFKPLFEMANTEILDQIRVFAPSLLFVSLGAGKAEKWIRMHLKDSAVPVCIGVGATVDFLAGRVKRAPKWMGDAGLEWLWRILQEPRRLLGRYLYDFPAFATAFVRQWLMERSLKRKRGQAVESVDVSRSEAAKVLRAGERLDASTVSTFLSSGTQALEQKTPLVIDLSSTAFIDSTGMGGLVGLEKQARDLGVSMALAAASPDVANLFKLARLTSFFTLAAGVDEAAALVAGDKAKETAETTLEGRRLVVSMADRLDYANSRFVGDALESLAERGGEWDAMVLNLAQLYFVDSAGLGMLIALRKTLANSGKSLVLRGLSGGPLNIVRLARLERYFLMEP